MKRSRNILTNFKLLLIILLILLAFNYKIIIADSLNTSYTLPNLGSNDSTLINNSEIELISHNIIEQLETQGEVVNDYDSVNYSCYA